MNGNPSGPDDVLGLEVLIAVNTSVGVTIAHGKVEVLAISSVDWKYGREGNIQVSLMI